MWCKHTNYEQATRAPLLIVAPKTSQRGTKSSAPVEFVDIYPTLIDLAGIKPETPLDGASLKPILDNPHATVKPLAISQYPRGGGRNQMMGYAYRDARYRLVNWYKLDTEGQPEKLIATELYDYEKDPLETRNLADDPEYLAARQSSKPRRRRQTTPPYSAPQPSSRSNRFA